MSEGLIMSLQLLYPLLHEIVITGNRHSVRAEQETARQEVRSFQRTVR